MRRSELDTPIGPIQLLSNGEALVEVVLPGSEPNKPVKHDGEDSILAEAKQQLKQYFSGRRTQFTVPLCIEGTEFQETAWEVLRGIPYGETCSYSDQAAALGKPGAARAVGQANRRNPLPIFVPCHRVLAADGTLGGYMGQRARVQSIKAWLLKLENGGRAASPA